MLILHPTSSFRVRFEEGSLENGNWSPTWSMETREPNFSSRIESGRGILERDRGIGCASLVGQVGDCLRRC